MPEFLYSAGYVASFNSVNSNKGPSKMNIRGKLSNKTGSAGMNN